MKPYTLTLAFLAVVAALAACEPADDPSLFPEFSPGGKTHEQMETRNTPQSNPLRNVYWGDLHIHTSLSTDAYLMGVDALPEDAYKFAKGEEIRHAAGYGIKIDRPLDFAAVTDHSEYLGAMRHLQANSPMRTRALRTRLLEDSPLRNTLAIARTLIGFEPGSLDVDGADVIAGDAWQSIIQAAQAHNNPGTFTTFIAYEWSATPERRNLHRNVIYRGTLVPAIPYSSVNSQDPRVLWEELEKQREQGMDNFAIPHNGNLSDGRMYDEVAFDGTAFDRDYALRRMRNEPLSEIFQVKGSSESHPELSPEDAFSDFEIYQSKLFTFERGKAQGSYARDALRKGIEFSHTEGFNPYRFGVIASTDGHNASSPAVESSYHGKLPMMDGSAGLRLGRSMLIPEDFRLSQRWSAQGLAAVWSEENTRDSLFEAMSRKETYATSGPRITVRFFGGWHYAADLIDQPDFLRIAYRDGVPMGADLPARTSAVPRFIVVAIKDPSGANLDRIQVVKGWVDSSGNSHERVFDVLLSDNRSDSKQVIDGTVDLTVPSYTNDIGSAQLGTVWSDPEFDASQSAFYYARAIEIPTPRWSTFDAVALGVAPPEPVSIQERAVTSAIWYVPIQGK